MASKWIINDGYLIIGDVEFHVDLVCKGRDKHKTIGGGRWNYDREANVIYFYGISIEFGQVTEEEFNNAFKQPSVEQATIFFSNSLEFHKVLEEYREICNKSI